MKLALISAFAFLALAGLPAQAATPIINIGISGEISPGVYGQVQFGNAPPPPVINAQPMIVVRQPSHVREEPLYLHVPPGHAKHWAKHCREYNACDRPVYFVKSAEYEPGYSERGRKKRHDEGRSEDHRRDGESRGRGRGDEGRGDEDRGRGRNRD